MPGTAPSDRAAAELRGCLRSTHCSAASKPQGTAQKVQDPCALEMVGTAPGILMERPAMFRSTGPALAEGKCLKEHYLQATVSKRAKNSMRSFC